VTDPELHTIEESHGKPRLTQPRLSDLETVTTVGEPSGERGPGGRFAPGNKVASGARAKRAIAAPLRDARKRVLAATDGQPATVADAVLRDALTIYRRARLELDASSIFVLSSLAAFATQSALTQYFTKRSAECGFDTERGLAMLEQAQRCEQQAQRAMTAALAATKALPKAGRKGRSILDAIEASAAAADAHEGEQP
jgi:hypothetical protein